MINILKFISIKDILKSLNITYRDNNDYYLINCIYHNDKHPSLSIKKDGFFKCFSCGEKGYITKFYKDFTGKSIYKSFDILNGNFLDYQYKNDSYEEIDFENEYRKKLEKEIIVKGNLLNVYDNKDVLKYLHNNGYSDKFIKTFNLSYCKFAEFNGTKYYDRIIIPIIEKNKIICYEGRDYTGFQKPKVLYHRNSIKSTLFNYDNLNRDKELIVVEGTKDLVKIYDIGFENVTCTFGSMINKRQYDFLNEFKEITLFIDNDEAGWKMLQDFDKGYNYDFYFTYPVKKGRDPNDLNYNETLNRLNHKKLYIEWLVDNFIDFKKKGIEW